VHYLSVSEVNWDEFEVQDESGLELISRKLRNSQSQIDLH
jgi:hypothetical protein